MPNNKKRFVQKKEPAQPRIRTKKIIPTYSHPQIERELERTRTSFERLLKTTKDADFKRRAGHFSWSVGEQFTHVTLYLDIVIPLTLVNAEKGQKMPQLPGWLGNTINFLSTRLKSGSNNRQVLLKRYQTAHERALDRLKKIKPDQLDQLVWTYWSQITIKELFLDHAKHFAEHETHIKRLLVKRSG